MLTDELLSSVYQN